MSQIEIKYYKFRNKTMAFVFKRGRDDINRSSNPNVGPGTYLGLLEASTDASNAPFMFNAQRKFEQKNSITPGPGAYSNKSGFDAPPDSQKLDVFKSPTQGFNSKSKKMVNSSSKNNVPGPGSYDFELSTLKKSPPRVDKKQNFNLLHMRSNPSIPSHDSIFGYEEADRGFLIQQPNPGKVYKGEKDDTIGPGQYEIPDNFSKKKVKGIKWDKYTSKRELHNNKNRTNGDFITPSDYNIFPIYKLKNIIEFWLTINFCVRFHTSLIVFANQGMILL